MRKASSTIWSVRTRRSSVLFTPASSNASRSRISTGAVWCDRPTARRRSPSATIGVPPREEEVEPDEAEQEPREPDDREQRGPAAAAAGEEPHLQRSAVPGPDEQREPDLRV